MAEIQLLIGNKRYSSWSLRGYLALAFANIDFKETVIPLFTDGMAEKMEAFAPTAPRKVPMIISEGHEIWDTMSIFEFAAENSKNGALWPEDKYARAHARSVVAEMHGGFFALRGHIPMNLSRNDPPEALPADVQADVDRIVEIWMDCRQKYGEDGPYLFGKLSLADAAFAPVAIRFKSCSVEVPQACSDYINAIYALADFVTWQKAAMQETWVIDQ